MRLLPQKDHLLCVLLLGCHHELNPALLLVVLPPPDVAGKAEVGFFSQLPVTGTP